MMRFTIAALCMSVCSITLITQTQSRTSRYQMKTRNGYQVPQVKDPHQNPFEEEDKKELALILSNVALIVNHFVKIVQDPHSKQNVAQGVGGIIGAIGNVIAQTVKSRLLVLDEDSFDALGLEEMITK
jgi:hypothetical protein